MQNEYRPEEALNDPPIATDRHNPLFFCLNMFQCQQHQAKRIVSKLVCEKNDDTTNYFVAKWIDTSFMHPATKQYDVITFLTVFELVVNREFCRSRVNARRKH